MIVDQLSSKAVMRRNTEKALRRYDQNKLKNMIDRANEKARKK